VTIVDPFLVPIPRKYLESKVEREYHERLIRTIDQLRQRTGGASDDVAESGTRELYPWVIDDPKEEVVNLHVETKLREFRGVTVSSNYTAVPWDWVKAKSRSTVTFPKYPENGDEIIVANGDGSKITLDGNGKNINGSNTGKIQLKYTSIRFKYFLDDNEWLAI